MRPKCGDPEDARDDARLDQVLDRQLVSDAVAHLSPAHRTVLVETFYHGGTLATVASQLGIPHGTARSWLHYALHEVMSDDDGLFGPGSVTWHLMGEPILRATGRLRAEPSGRKEP